jgi:hypothetical protein
MLNQVYELFRRERGGAGEPAFDFVTDVAVDSEVERVLVHGLDVVVFGRNFRDGQSYVYTTLAFASADDLTAVDARDLTGDGKAEILVRGVVRANAGEASHPVTVERHLFLVYEATESGLKRSFAAETGRAIESERVISSVRFLPDSSIELVPGIAVGWTSGTYPFAKDEGPRDGVYPPALPWGGQSQRFVFRGGEFVPQ